MNTVFMLCGISFPKGFIKLESKMQGQGKASWEPREQLQSTVECLLHEENVRVH